MIWAVRKATWICDEKGDTYDEAFVATTMAEAVAKAKELRRSGYTAKVIKIYRQLGKEAHYAVGTK